MLVFSAREGWKRGNVWYLIRTIIDENGWMDGWILDSRKRGGVHNGKRKQEIVLETTWPPRNPILSRSLVNWPRGNSSRERREKFDFAVMTVLLAIASRYGEIFAR